MSAQSPMMSVSLFQKSLQDLVKGIRTHKRDPSAFISQGIAEIKQELKTTDPFVKAQAVRKLTYLQMIGYDVSWASFSIVEVMSQSRFAHKRVGYLAACQCFTESTDVVLLTTNHFKKEFLSQSQYDIGLAVNCVANIVTRDLAKDLISDMVSLISHPKPYVRKKALLAMYKLYTKFPQGLRLTFDRLKERLEDTDSSVVSCAVNVICELANKNPRNYIAMAPKFFRLLTTSSNNWMLIKVVKLLGSLVSEEPRLARKLLEPLATIIQNTHAKSLQYECIHTCTLALPHTKREDGTEARNVPQIVRLCSEHLRMFTEDPDQNLKYLGLVGFVNLMHSHPRVVVEHRELVLRCLHDDDITIRTRALELLTGMVTRRSLAELVTQLLTHVKVAEGMYRDELISKILFMCSRDKFAFLTDFAWYLSVLCVLATVEGSQHGQDVADQLMEVTLRVDTIRPYAVECMLKLLLDDDLVLGRKRASVTAVLKAAAWIVGEYCEYLIDMVNDTKIDMVTEDDEAEGVYWIEGPGGDEIRSQFRGRTLHASVLEALLHPRVTNLDANVQAAYIQSAIKVFIRACMDCSPEHLRLCMKVLETRLGVFLQSLDIEVQERASTFRHLLAEFEILKFETVDDAEDLEGPKVSQTKTNDANGTHARAPALVHVMNLLDPFESLVETAQTHTHTLLPLQNKDGVSVAKQKGRTLFACVCEPFYIVNPKAQKRVPVPEGLELEAPFDRAALDRLLNSEEPEMGPKDLSAISFSIIPAGDVTIRIVGIGSDGFSQESFANPLANQQLSEEDRKLGEVIGETFDEDTSAQAATASQKHTNAQRSKEAELFYLGGSKAALNGDTNEPIPMIRLSDADLAARPEDFFGGPRKKKTQKKAKKSSRVSVNTMDVMPVGVADGSSDDDVQSSRKRGKGGKGEALDLKDVDITTPLREDEVIPENKHRQPAQPSKSQTPTEPIAADSKDRGEADTKSAKKKSKKEKGAKKRKEKEIDLLDLRDAPENLSQPAALPPTKKKLVWTPLISSTHIQAHYACSLDTSGNTISVNMRGTVVGRDTITDVRCITKAVPNGYEVAGAGSNGVLLASRAEPSADFEGLLTVRFNRALSIAGGVELSANIKHSVDALIQETVHLRCTIFIPSCCFFTPYPMTQEALTDLMSKGQWAETKTRMQYSGKTKTVFKAIGSYLNAHTVETESTKAACYSARTLAGAMVCVLAKRTGEGTLSVEVRASGTGSAAVTQSVANELNRLEL